LRKSFVAVLAIIGCSVLVAGCTSTTTKGGTGTTPSVPSGSPSSSSAAPSASGNETIAASELQSKVVAAMKAATTFHLVGTGTDGGKPLSFDIHFAPHKAAGWVKQEGQKIELINPGGASLYFRLPGALWKQLASAQAATMFTGKWVKVPANDKNFAPLAQAFDAQSFTGGISDEASGDLAKVGPATVEGVAATEYKSASDGTQVFIAVSGPPVILKAVDKASDGGTVTFSDYDKPYAPTLPPASQTVDFSKMTGH
jgi:hypothetical protein